MHNDFSLWGESYSPNNDDESFGWRIKRADHTKPFKMAVISARHYGVYTHFHNRRTVPHLVQNCLPCEEGKMPRWYGYFLAKLYPAGEKIVFEFTAKCAETVIKAEQDYTSLRGLIVVASRPGGRENSPVHIQIGSKSANPADLPEAQDVRPILARIWGYTASAKIPLLNIPITAAGEHTHALNGSDRTRFSVHDAKVNEFGEIQGMVERTAQNFEIEPAPNGKRV